MPDLTSEKLIEYQLEVRVTRLTDQVQFLYSLDEEHWETIAELTEGIHSIKVVQLEIIEAVSRLLEKKSEIGQRLGVFSSHVIKRLEKINKRLNAQENEIKKITNKMENLTLN